MEIYSIGAKLFAFLLTHVFCQVALFIFIWFNIKTNKNFRCVCKKLQDTFPLAKSSAALISFNISLLILFTLKFFRRYLWVPTSDPPLIFHYIISSYILIWSGVHSIAHYINLSKSKKQEYLTWGVGYTGIILWILLLFVAVCCIHKSVLRHTNNCTHHLIFLLFFLFLLFHQSFCFVKTDNGKCPFPISWIFVTPPLLIFLAENLFKYFNSITTIKNVIKHNNIIEFVTPLDATFAGKTVWLCCPQINYFEWHHFVVTATTGSYPYTNTSIHFTPHDTWTKKFAKLLGVEFDARLYGLTFPVVLPKILVQGPFHCYPKHILNTIQTSNCVLIADDIGTTTFSYLLSQLQNLTVLTPTLTILFIVKHPFDLDWLLPTLTSLNSKFQTVDIHLSFTDIDPFVDTSHLCPLPFIIGRPDLKKFIRSHYISKCIQVSLPSKITIPVSNIFSFCIPQCPKTNVYFSGSSNLFQELVDCSREYKPYYRFVKL